MCVRVVTICLCLLVSSCLQAPRKNLFPKKIEIADAPLTSTARRNTSETVSQRFVDTSYVRLSKKDANAVQRMFDEALADYDDGQYAASDKQFSLIAETLDEDDSLNFEARFMICECRIQLNVMDQAVQRLNSLLHQSNTPAAIREKSLLRLGQVYCALEKKDEAKKVFRQFVTEFPKSAYKSLANCESVQK